jgi:hypothetical protein
VSSIVEELNEEKAQKTGEKGALTARGFCPKKFAALIAKQQR